MSRFVVGLVIGAVMASIGAVAGLRSAEDNEAYSVVTTTTGSPVGLEVEPDWSGEGGVRFESTVVLMDGIEVADGATRLSYELVSLGQVPFEFFPEPFPGVVPEVWLLTTSAGTTVEASTGPPRISNVFVDQPSRPSGSVRFDLADTVELVDIETIEITGWRVATPVEFKFSLETVAGAAINLFDGTKVSLKRILEQRNGTIIAFDVDSPPDPWRPQPDQGFGPSTQFRPIGQGWLTASTSEDGFQLTWQEATAPPTLTVEVVTVAWLATNDTSPVVIYPGPRS